MTASATSSVINGVDTQALSETVEAVRQNPALAQVTFELGSDWVNGCYQRAVTGSVHQAGEKMVDRTARYSFESDEPAALLGTDQAASPAEYVLQALAGCYAVTFASNAASRGITLSSLRLDMEVDFDLQGFLSVDASVRPGAQQVRVTVHAQSPDADRTQLEELTEVVQQRSPIHDTLGSPVQVITTLAIS